MSFSKHLLHTMLILSNNKLKTNLSLHKEENVNVFSLN